ncbi:MAG: site-specific DNA-methyltransferase [Deltaproteobacteria bacterium]|nr:site-specific DNA-methyltransferase [Deltaproteobacteria bacterium]
MPIWPSASIDFTATEPPYNIHLKQTMAGDKYAEEFANRRTDYNMHSSEEGDIANAEDYPAYLDAMEKVFEQCYRVLKSKKYMAVILRNAYQDSRYILTNADLTDRAQKVGFVLKGEKIWYQAGTRLRPYGYPYAYVPNITHQFIMIFRKGK